MRVDIEFIIIYFHEHLYTLYAYKLSKLVPIFRFDMFNNK